MVLESVPLLRDEHESDRTADERCAGALGVGVCSQVFVHVRWCMKMMLPKIRTVEVGGRGVEMKPESKPSGGGVSVKKYK